MAQLAYKLEYYQGAAGPADEGVFIQLRTDVPAYQHVITKEVYFGPENTNHSEFCNALFNIAGVVRLSSQAHRLYIEKSPVFTWQEILGPVFNVLNYYTGTSGVVELPGSGVTLSSVDDRRSF